MPEEFTSRNDSNEFLTPSFEWSTVPPETTEIAILIGQVAQDGFEKLQPTSNALWPGSLVLSERWILVGLDASTTSLAQTSLSSPPPAGSVELPNDSYNGDEPRNLFVGPRFPERHFLFAVLALCDRQVDLDPYNAGQLRGDAIAVGWFIAEPPW